jgi:putative colanic acid biosynthesis acetyltransferase WcaF
VRGLWKMVQHSIFQFSPIPLHGLRVILLRAFGAQIGKDCHVYPTVSIWAPWNLILGDRVGIGSHANIYNMDRISIGHNAVISQGAHICAGSHDVDSASFQLITSQIVIGSEVWIAAEAFIGPGVTINTGCVVGARGVVFRSINTEWTIWVGNPARFLRNRKRTPSDL